MKMIYGNMPVKNLNIVKHDVSTADATVSPSDLQAGITCYARGQKVIGTGKSFEFADYGMVIANFPIDIPTNINVVEITSLMYPIKATIALNNMKNMDFSSTQQLAIVVVDGVEYPITVNVQDNLLTFNCDIDLDLQAFYGKDNYV